jgi:hypothetical protein
MQVGLTLVAMLLSLMFIPQAQTADVQRFEGESLKAYRVFEEPRITDRPFVFVVSQFDSVESAQSAYAQVWANVQDMQASDFTDIFEISGDDVADESRWFTALSPEEVEVTGVIFRNANLVHLWTLSGTIGNQLFLSQLAGDYVASGTPADLDETTILQALPDLQQIPLDGFALVEEEVLTGDAVGAATPSPQS